MSANAKGQELSPLLQAVFVFRSRYCRRRWFRFRYCGLRYLNFRFGCFAVPRPVCSGAPAQPALDRPGFLFFVFPACFSLFLT